MVVRPLVSSSRFITCVIDGIRSSPNVDANPNQSRQYHQSNLVYTPYCQFIGKGITEVVYNCIGVGFEIPDFYMYLSPFASTRLLSK